MDSKTLIDVGLNPAQKLLDSGHLVIAALLLLIAIVLFAAVAFYRDSKESTRMLYEVQIKTIESINLLTTELKYRREG